MDDFQGLFDNSDSQLLFTIVSSLFHHSVNESLYYWALDLLETSFLISSSCEGEEDLGLDGFDVQICHEGNILALDTFI